MKKILFIFSLFLLLVACSKSKEQIIDRCLSQANQTFPNDLILKGSHFQGCMLESKYHFNARFCDVNKSDDVLSGICYLEE
jgi:hypothetical protein